MLSLHALEGMWRRLSLEWPGEPPDVSSSVHWLQGPRFFVDLRQPVDPPDFTGISCLRQLQLHHLAWLATQQGFAGSLLLAGDVAWWRRSIDFQPRSATPDRARLQFADGILEERGTELAYLESWVSETAEAEPAYGLRLTDPGATLEGYLVRVGSRFMYARGRANPLPRAENLTAILEATQNLAERQDLLDCEISLGRIDPKDGFWRIDRSTLPFRRGAVLATCLHVTGNRFSTNDIDCDGNERLCDWLIAERDAPSEHLSSTTGDEAAAEPEPAMASASRFGQAGGAP